MEKGYHYTKNEARNTRIWAADKLLEYCQELPRTVISEPTTLVELRDENGNFIEYKDTPETLRIKAKLERVNRINGRADILFGRHKISTHLVAIYRNNFNLYGRLHTKGYNHLQRFTEKERSEFTINGDSVVELDFSAMHPYLLYASEGVQYSGDPYTVIDPRADKNNRNLRLFYKEAMLSLINARGKYAPKNPKPGQKTYWRTAKVNAASSINRLMNMDKYLPQEKRKKGLKLTERNREEMKRVGTVRPYLEQVGFNKSHDIIEAIMEAHPKIAHHFCNDVGTGMLLVNKEARIALDICTHFAKQGIPILSVHDSFIVQQKYHDELKEVMQKMYKKHSGGFSCIIK